MFENRQIAVIEVKFRRFQNSFECLKKHYAANNWPIWTQKVPKEAYRCRIQTSIRVFQKKNCCTWAVGCQKFVQYIRILCPGRFILVESVTFLEMHAIRDFFKEAVSWISPTCCKILIKKEGLIETNSTFLFTKKMLFLAKLYIKFLAICLKVHGLTTTITKSQLRLLKKFSE